MKSRLMVCALSFAALSIAACGRDEAQKPASSSASLPPAANEYSLPAPADASKGEDKKEEAKPMPPAAPTAPPAEGVKK